MKDNFYYIDKNGNKKKYAGKILYSGDNTYMGILTTQSTSEREVELVFHPEVKPVEGYYAYYTYVNNLGEEVRYYSIVKQDKNGNPFFSYSISKDINLKYVPASEIKTSYFTFMQNGKEKLYGGRVITKGTTYFGKI